MRTVNNLCGQCPFGVNKIKLSAVRDRLLKIRETTPYYYEIHQSSYRYDVNALLNALDDLLDSVDE